MNTLMIYENVTSGTAERIVAALQANPDEPFTVAINSYGGEVAAAIGVCNEILKHRGKVTTRIDGVAASAASAIACAAHTCVMAENGLLMIHSAHAEINGKSDDFRQFADVLDKHTELLAKIYTRRAPHKAREIAAMLADAKDHWFNATEALAMGLIDAIEGIADPVRIAACLTRLNLLERFGKMSIESAAASPPDASGINANDIEARAQLMERQRQSEIRAAFAPWIRKMESPALTALQETLLKNGASPSAASERLLFALGAMSEPLAAGQGAMSNPVGYGGYGAAHFSAGAIDALALRMGAKLKNPHAAATEFRHHSLENLMELSLHASGVNTHGMNRNAKVNAALTTSDFPNLFGSAVNRTLNSHFEALTQDHRELCDQGDVPDFKPSKAVNVSMFPALKLKPETAETQYGAISENAEGYKLATYSRIFSFSREAQINDDLGGFQSLIQAAGNAAARLERDLVFGVLTANKALADGVALFHANHKNLDNSHSAVNVAGLGIARSLMRKQVDSSNAFIMASPRFLIVPVSLETEAEALIGSLSYRTDLSEMQTPTWVKGLRIVADPRLDAVDAADWYLLSEPTIAPVIRLAFLNGQRGPVVEQENDFSRDVIQYKCRLDVAACAVGYAGAVKMS